MNHASRVRVLQAERSLPSVFERGRNWQRSVLFYDLVQIPSCNVRHDEEVMPVRFVCVVGNDDVWMAESGDGLDFALKPPSSLRGSDDFRRQDL